MGSFSSSYNHKKLNITVLRVASKDDEYISNFPVLLLPENFYCKQMKRIPALAGNLGPVLLENFYCTKMKRFPALAGYLSPVLILSDSDYFCLRTNLQIPNPYLISEILQKYNFFRR